MAALDFDDIPAAPVQMGAITDGAANVGMAPKLIDAVCPAACDPLRRNGNATRQKRHRERQRDAGMQLARVWLDFDTRQDLQEIAGRHGLSLESTIAWAIKDLADRLLSRR